MSKEKKGKRQYLYQSMRARLSPDLEEETRKLEENLGLEELYRRMIKSGMNTKQGFDAYVNRTSEGNNEEVKVESLHEDEDSLLTTIGNMLLLGEKLRNSESDRDALLTLADNRANELPRGCNIAARGYYRLMLASRRFTGRPKEKE